MNQFVCLLLIQLCFHELHSLSIVAYKFHNIPSFSFLRMASSFELSSDQPKAGIYYQRARRLAGSVCKTNSWNVIQQLLIFSANSYQNLFGEPTERHRPISKKVSKTTPPEPKSRKPKPLPVDPLTGEVIGQRDPDVTLRQLSAPAPVKTKRSPGGNHTQLW